MIDIETETLIALRDACREPVFCHGGKPIHISGMYRYIMRGAKAANGQRIRLETVRTPGGLRTSREAISRFISTLTDPGTAIPPPTTAARRRQIESAEKELARAGFDLT
jgi:hypothetical protein